MVYYARRRKVYKTRSKKRKAVRYVPTHFQIGHGLFKFKNRRRMRKIRKK